MTELHRLARAALQASDPADKLGRVRGIAVALEQGLPWREPGENAGLHTQPGRPAVPRLVGVKQLPRRRLSTRAGCAAFLHALAHIEFNAINLALDAVCRFRGLPADFYADWLSVAIDEALHFELLCGRMAEYACRYGDYDAHDGLWEMARRTAHDPLIRMALVPRVLEARGLDVTPGMIERLHKAGDTESGRVLGIILADEIGHVAKGTRWFHYLCRQRRLDPFVTFRALLAEYRPGRLGGPFNTRARSAAGFDEEELAMLTALSGQDGSR